MTTIKDPHLEYAVARAVWLYGCWCRAIATRHDRPSGTARARVLGDRLTRWLRDADRALVAEYYRRIA